MPIGQAIKGHIEAAAGPYTHGCRPDFAVRVGKPLEDSVANLLLDLQAISLAYTHTWPDYLDWGR